MSSSCETRVQVPPLPAPERADTYLSGVLGISRARVRKLCSNDLVTLAPRDLPVKPSHKLHGGEVLRIFIPPPPPETLEPEAIPIEVLFEDEWVLVLNKPKGLVVHPGGGSRSGTLVNALLWHTRDLSDLNSRERPGIVHRLDKETSGVLVVAKTNAAHEDLARQIAARAVKREYWALVEGCPTPAEGRIEAPIGRHPVRRKEMAIRPDGRRAATDYRVIERFRGYALVEARLETGRTHQIRVHLKYLRHPVVGDAVYGKGTNPFGIRGQALHARTLGFVHPGTGEYREFAAPLPADFARALGILRGNR